MRIEGSHESKNLILFLFDKQKCNFTQFAFNEYE